jgi:hypothetical protein
MNSILPFSPAKEPGKISCRTGILLPFDNWREAYPLFPVRTKEME